MINRFAIYAPALGKREDYPNILLHNAFTYENSNVQVWDGELRTAKMRKKELQRTIYDISSIDTSADTITISGDHTAEFVNGDTITVYDSDNNHTQLTLNTTSQAVSGTTLISVAENLTSSTPSDNVFKDDQVASTDPASTDFLKVQPLDGNEIMRYERLILSTGTERLVGFTKAHIYYWDTSLTRWSLLFTCASDCDYWDADQCGDYLVATNNIDRPVQWDGGSATNFENMDTLYSSSQYIATAEFVKAYRNYVFLGNVTLSDSTVLQHYIYWSNVGEGISANGFRQDLSGDAGSAYIEGSGEITGGFGLWEGYLCIFKRWSTRKLWYTGGTIPFEQDVLNPAVGCVSPGSVINDKDGKLYFYGTDKAFREISSGKISYALNDTTRDVNPEYVAKIRSTYIDEYDEIWWAIPYGNSAVANNKIVVYKEGKWTERDVSVTAFGKYSRQAGYTWDTLPFSSWDTWGWDSWDATDASADFPIDLCSDSSGYTYEAHGAYTDNGSAFTNYFTLTTDLAKKGALPHYKRILWMYIYVRNEASGTLTFTAKRDNEANWQSLGDVSLTGDEDILRVLLPVDTRARHFLIRGSGTDKFSFVGIEFEYEPAGER